MPSAPVLQRRSRVRTQPWIAARGEAGSLYFRTIQAIGDGLGARQPAYLFSRSRISLPVLKNGTNFSSTGTLSPVRGLRPVRA